MGKKAYQLEEYEIYTLKKAGLEPIEDGYWRCAKCKEVCRNTRTKRAAKTRSFDAMRKWLKIHVCGSSNDTPKSADVQKLLADLAKMQKQLALANEQIDALKNDKDELRTRLRKTKLNNKALRQRV